MERLSELLGRQETRIADLLELLQREQDLLVQATPQGECLAAVAHSKQQCVNELEALEEERQALQMALGYGADLEDSGRAAVAAGETARWDRLQTLRHQATHRNHLNGTLIRQRMLHNQQVLEDLRRLVGNTVYSPSGCYLQADQARIEIRA